ncbi:MAG: hypothetical protein Q7S06_03615, partial [Nanoarchaeota archaeon]|nr:hypothetical protein [Nanoarchaeota archaeon]
ILGFSYKIILNKITGHVTNNSGKSWLGPNKVYEGKISKITIGTEKYDVRLISVNSDNAATVSVNNLQGILSPNSPLLLNNIELNLKTVKFYGISSTNNYVTFTYRKSGDNNVISNVAKTAAGVSVSGETPVDNSKNYVSCIKHGKTVQSLYLIKVGFVRIPFPVQYNDYCEGVNNLRKYSCSDKIPMYQDITCASGCKKGACVSASEANDDLLMQDCVVNCDVNKCNSLSDSKKKKASIEQYILSCDNNLCLEENCARKLALFNPSKSSRPALGDKTITFKEKNACSGNLISQSSSLSNIQECFNFCYNLAEATCCRISADGKCLAFDGGLFDSSSGITINDGMAVDIELAATGFEIQKACSREVVAQELSAHTPQECLNFCQKTSGATCCQFSSDNGYCYARKGFVISYYNKNVEAVSLVGEYYNNFSKPFTAGNGCFSTSLEEYLGDEKILFDLDKTPKTTSEIETACTNFCEQVPYVNCCAYYIDVNNDVDCSAKVATARKSNDGRLNAKSADGV